MEITAQQEDQNLLVVLLAQQLMDQLDSLQLDKPEQEEAQLDHFMVSLDQLLEIDTINHQLYKELELVKQQHLDFLEVELLMVNQAHLQAVELLMDKAEQDYQEAEFQEDFHMGKLVLDYLAVEFLAALMDKVEFLAMFHTDKVVLVYQVAELHMDKAELV